MQQMTTQLGMVAPPAALGFPAPAVGGFPLQVSQAPGVSVHLETFLASGVQWTRPALLFLLVNRSDVLCTDNGFGYI